jgi:hypothetical protein
MPSCTDRELGATVPRTHPRHRDCTHAETVNVISDGLERVICEQCGHVSIRYESMISGDVRRSQFPRRADQLARETMRAT